VLVELSLRKREIRGDGGNRDEKLGLNRILCASKLTIPESARRSSDPACNNPDTRFSKSNLESCTADF
jgi:hypothetical protein